MKIQLEGSWRLRADGEADTIPVQIPGDNYSALQDAGRIPDPYWRDNEAKVQWVADRDWSFSSDFDAPPELLRQRAVFLSFDSIDTVADVFVNGRLAGHADNQFRRWRYEVRRLLRPGANTLEVRITSPRRAAADAVAAAHSRVAPLSQNDGTVVGINFLRKCQCSPGWDWGISLPASGIYGDVSLFGADAAVLDSAWCVQHHRAGACRVDVVVRLIPVPGARPGAAVEARVAFDGETRAVRGRVPASQEPFELRTTFRVASPRLWWPAGYGDQPLYPLSVEACGQRIERKVGLRRLEIVTTPDKAGARFAIRVNGVDVFAKGADWIPCDARPRHESPRRVRDLLESAVAANMNTLRVWGGGHFESDFFYDECDRLGLLLWHDMMFACMTYPSHPEFIASVQAEIGHQVRRLRDHASIALWCGDNECIGAIGWHASDDAGRQRNLAHYAILNEAIGVAVGEADPSRLFWPSSPSAGPGEFAYNDGNSGRGDTHFWAVWHGGARFSHYYRHRPRFCSEFGFQSFPSLETTRTFASEKDGDFNVFSPVFDRHQKCPAGNSNIMGMFGTYFRMPSDFGKTLYLSQVQQSVAIGTGAEWWRSLRPHCMGTVFWQLNDNWPVSSWSSVEYGGRWKALHYAARRFYAPLAAFARIRDGKFEANLVWDLPLAVDATTTFTLRRLADGESVASWTFRNALRHAASRRLAVPDLAGDAAERKGLAPNECFVTIETKGADAIGRPYSHGATVFLDAWKRCELPRNGLRVESVSPATDEPGAFDVVLTADAPAFFVWLSVDGDPGGRFSDNLVTILPGRRAMRYCPGCDMAADDLRRRLSVTDLRASYN